MVKYLSVSGLKNYLTCPYKYKLAQVERLRPIVPKAFFTFGKTIHKSIELKIKENRTVVDSFQEYWGYEEPVEMDYGSETHKTLMEKGKALLKTWESNETTQELLEVKVEVEKSIYKEIEGVPLYGIIDYLSDDVVLDWKTAQREFNEHKTLDLQLPFYSLLLEDTNRQYGFGVLIKNKTPKVQYLFLSKIETKNLKTLIKKVWSGICKEDFTPIPNTTCEYCDYLLLCLGKEGTKDMFMKDESYNLLLPKLS